MKIIKFNEPNFGGYTFSIFLMGVFVGLNGWLILLAIPCFIIAAKFYQHGEDFIKIGKSK